LNRRILHTSASIQAAGGTIMKQQKVMVESFLMAHRDFMKGLDNSFSIIERDLDKAANFDVRCKGEWCSKMESSIDELANSIYSISEPRWSSDQDSKMITNMRHRVHDIYAKFKGINTDCTH
jgi:hypothetical protein